MKITTNNGVSCNDDVTDGPCVCVRVCVYAVLLRTASSQSISRQLAESTVNTVVRRLYTVRRREAGRRSCRRVESCGLEGLVNVLSIKSTTVRRRR